MQNITDFSPLGACTSLVDLTLACAGSKSAPADISALSSCTALTNLRLRNSTVASLAPLTACVHLRSLKGVPTSLALAEGGLLQEVFGGCW